MSNTPAATAAEPVECTCFCHTSRALHIKPCCQACPKCRRRFSSGLKVHQASCDRERGLTDAR